jgi:protease-4
VLEVAQGRVWTGAQAKERGLVDDLGGFADALIVTRQEIGLEADAPIELRPFPPPRTLWEQALDLAFLGGIRQLSVETLLERLAPGVLSTPPIVVR